MRRESENHILYNKSKQIRIRNKQVRAANRKRHCRFIRRRNEIKNADYYEAVSLRKKITYGIYRNKLFNEPKKIITIDKAFGVEEQPSIVSFLDYAESFIDFNSKELVLNISKCNRVWPSAVTLFCSLMQWVELTSSTNHRPKILSSRAENTGVDDYLFHCGFYNYVNVSRPTDTHNSKYSDIEVVKIERETKKDNIEKRSEQITDLLDKYSVLTPEEIELFSDVVLIEAMSNVTEHGIYHRDYGWWLLAQYHPTHKIISLCVADNGIGIRHSLMTGPQRKEIGLKLKDTPENDGEFLFLALNENVSGSVNAPIREVSTFLSKSYKSGARRGNGLKRIKDKCKTLGIPFSFLSHYGYLFVDDQGRVVLKGSRKSIVFAGTMIQFTIKAKERQI